MRSHIIFDLDGTLLDSMSMWEGLGQRYLQSRGVMPPENLQRKLKAMSLLQFATYCIEKFSFAEAAEQIVAEIAAMVSESYCKTIPLKEGVYSYLMREKEKGTKMCVLTASEAWYTKEALKRLHILDCFSFVMTCTEMRRGKDTPELYRLAAERLGGREKDTAVFEDTLLGVQMAKQAGYYVIGVNDPSAEEDKKEIQSICDKYIYSYLEL